MYFRSIFLFVAVFTLAGCASTFETRTYKSTDSEGIQNGIAYFEAVPYLVNYVFSMYEENGVPATSKCTKTSQKFDIQFNPGRKMVLVGHPSNFSSSTLGITLNQNGTLAGINSATTPVADKLLGTLELALKDKVVSSLAEGLQKCNATPIVNLYKKVDNFEDIPKMLAE